MDELLAYRVRQLKIRDSSIEDFIPSALNNIANGFCNCQKMPSLKLTQALRQSLLVLGLAIAAWMLSR